MDAPHQALMDFSRVMARLCVLATQKAGQNPVL